MRRQGEQVEAQDAVLVHPAHFVNHAAFLLQQAQKERAIRRVMAKIGIDELAAAPQGAQGACRHAL